MASTLKDVSKVTGYSLITISRALNCPEKLKPETLEKVQKAIAECGYHPNTAAQALVNRRTSIIYVYIPGDLTVSTPFFVQVVAGIGEGLGQLGYSMLIKRSWYAGEPCDGLILMGLSEKDDARLRELVLEKPAVVFGNNTVADCFDVDNRLGEELAVDLAWEKGYRQLAYIGIDQKKVFCHDRQKGFEDGLKKHHLQAVAMAATNNKEESGYSLTKTLLKKTPRPDLFVCASDDLAIGALRAINEAGLAIPSEVGIIGFDGLGSEKNTFPRLSTIHQPIFEVGEELAKAIVDKVKAKAVTSSSAKTTFYPPVVYLNGTTR